MLFFIIMVAAVLFIAIRSPMLLESITGGDNFADVRALQKDIHEYSGIAPDQYMSYITNMDNAMDTISIDPAQSATYLHKALEDLKSVALDIPGGDSHIPGEINEHAARLGKLFEAYIMHECMQKGVRFEPAYLNNIFIEDKYQDEQ